MTRAERQERGQLVILAEVCVLLVVLNAYIPAAVLGLFTLWWACAYLFWGIPARREYEQELVDAIKKETQ